MNSKPLLNKVAFITGGTRGIGRALSLKLGLAGADIFLTYRKESSMAEEVVDLIQKNGSKAFAEKMEVSDRDSVQSTFNRFKDKFGKLDILVNNAGINKPTDFDKIEDDDWDEILNVNLKGPFLCSQIALNFFSKQGGSIINIGSVSGQYGGPRTAHYAASKAGLISLGQVIARFGASRNIRCNTIAAGLIESEMAAGGMKSPAVKKAAESIPLLRMGTPDEVASAAIFLGSDQSTYITAQTINVNGGLYF